MHKSGSQTELAIDFLQDDTVIGWFLNLRLIYFHIMTRSGSTKIV